MVQVEFPACTSVEYIQFKVEGRSAKLSECHFLFPWHCYLHRDCWAGWSEQKQEANSLKLFNLKLWFYWADFEVDIITNSQRITQIHPDSVWRQTSEKAAERNGFSQCPWDIIHNLNPFRPFMKVLNWRLRKVLPCIHLVCTNTTNGNFSSWMYLLVSIYLTI